MGIPKHRIGGLIGKGVLVDIILGAAFASTPLCGSLDRDQVMFPEPFNASHGGRLLLDHRLHQRIGVLIKLCCGIIEHFTHGNRRMLGAFGGIKVCQCLVNVLSGLFQQPGMLMQHVFNANWST